VKLSISTNITSSVPGDNGANANAARRGKNPRSPAQTCPILSIGSDIDLTLHSPVAFRVEITPHNTLHGANTVLKICYVKDDGHLELLFEGEVSLAQMEHAFEAVFTGPEFPAEGGMLVDVTRVEEVHSADEVRELATFLGSKTDHVGQHVGVVVSSSNPAQYGTARMLSAYAESEGLTIGVFTSVEKASEWLNSTRS